MFRELSSVHLWRVHEGELHDLGAVMSLRPVVLQLLAPRTERQAGKGGVVHLALGNHLLDTLQTELIHLCRGVLPQLAHQPLDADPC